MQVLLDKIFTDVDDKEMKDKTGKPFTLRDAAKQALIAPFQDEQNLSLEEKVKRYDLYLKVKDATDPTDLSTEEVVLVKKLIGRAYGVLVVGQAVGMLEGR